MALTICMASAACVLGDMAINVELAYTKARAREATPMRRAAYPPLSLAEVAITPPSAHPATPQADAVLLAATGAFAGMTRDGVAAIHVYTQESALYSMLNKILRSRGEERKTALSPFMQYHKLLMTALGQVRARPRSSPTFNCRIKVRSEAKSPAPHT